MQGWEDPPATPGRRVAITVVVAAAVLSGGLLGRVDDPTAIPVETVTPAPEAEGAAPLGHWRSLPDPPVGWASPPRVVWTGTEALVWGGRASDGGPLLLAYNPATDRWREAAPPPIEARGLPVVAWTGAAEGSTRPELVVWGGLSGDGRAVLGDGAAYDPTTDRWRELPDAPIAPRAAAAGAWNGKELLIAGGVGDDVRRLDGAAYDPATDSWRPIAGLPPSGRLIGHTTLRSERWLTVVVAHDGVVRLLRYNHLRDRWRAEALPLPSTGHRSVVAADRRVVVWGQAAGADAGVVWNRPGAMRQLAAGAFPPRGFHGAAWTGEHVVVWGGYDGGGRRGDGAALDPVTGSWHPLADAPLSPRTLPGMAWTGEELLVIGGTDDAGPAIDGAAWRAR